MSKTKALVLPEPDAPAKENKTVPRVVYKCTRCMHEHVIRAYGYAMFRCVVCSRPMDVSFPDRTYE